MDCYRHGEICFEKIKSIPKDIKLSKDKVLLKGSHGNPHSFDNGEYFPKKKDDFIFGYFRAKDTTLFHVEHGKEVKLPDGNYRLRRQVEYINEELKQVED